MRGLADLEAAARKAAAELDMGVMDAEGASELLDRIAEAAARIRQEHHREINEAQQVVHRCSLAWYTLKGDLALAFEQGERAMQGLAPAPHAGPTGPALEVAAS